MKKLKNVAIVLILLVVAFGFKTNDVLIKNDISTVKTKDRVLNHLGGDMYVYSEYLITYNNGTTETQKQDVRDRYSPGNPGGNGLPYVIIESIMPANTGNSQQEIWGVLRIPRFGRPGAVVIQEEEIKSAKDI